jgi:hypothetical protein
MTWWPWHHPRSLGHLLDRVVTSLPGVQQYQDQDRHQHLTSIWTIGNSEIHGGPPAPKWFKWSFSWENHWTGQVSGEFSTITHCEQTKCPPVIWYTLWTGSHENQFTSWRWWFSVAIFNYKRVAHSSWMTTWWLFHGVLACLRRFWNSMC